MENILVGKTILEIKIATDKKAILFITEDGEHIAKCDGDCCSSTWIENIETPVLGFPATVIYVEDIALGDDEENDYGLIAHYGLKINTDKGDIILDYRNESNGYYGGNLSWENDDYYYGGVYGQNVSTCEWQKI